jgi:transcriptional regulator with XRE-family HTH domain
MKLKLDTVRLKELREKKGWSKNQAAQEMGLLQSAYLRYESGENLPSNSVIKIMALTLGTSVEYLSGKSKESRPLEYIIDCEDPRLGFVIEKFQSGSEEQRERIYKYIKKTCAQD